MKTSVDDGMESGKNTVPVHGRPSGNGGYVQGESRHLGLSISVSQYSSFPCYRSHVTNRVAAYHCLRHCLCFLSCMYQLSMEDVQTGSAGTGSETRDAKHIRMEPEHQKRS